MYSPIDAGAGADGGNDATAVAAAAAAAATALKGSGNGADGGADDKWKGLVTDPDNLAYVKTKNWQSPEDTVKSYRELEVENSKSKLKLPTKESKPEEVDAFYEALGKPKEAKGYEFKIADSVPEHFPYEEATAEGFKEIAHKARLLPDQAQILHDWYVDNTVKAFDGSLKTAATRIEAAHTAIVKEFGDPEGSEYKRKVELADRAVRELSPGKDKKALRAELVELGALTPDGKVMAPNLIIALSRIGQDLYSEDKVYSGLALQHNPWKKETENLTQQGKFIEQDPEMARQLILAANLNPKDYGLNAPT
jgi:hypothetical protein